MQLQARLREEEYDYIVVGSGAGGGPVAANLARAGFTVALMEAGGADMTCDYEVPAFFPKYPKIPNYAGTTSSGIMTMTRSSGAIRKQCRMTAGSAFGIRAPERSAAVPLTMR